MGVSGDAGARRLKGALEIVHDGRSIYTAPVDQHLGSRRRYWWDTFVTRWTREIHVRLLDEEGGLAAEKTLTIRVLPEANERVLVVGAVPRSIQQAERAVSLAWTSASASQLPASPLPLLGYDTIVMIKPEELDAWQQEAIRRWIELGGRLVLATGREYASVRHGFWKEISPVAVRDLATVREGDEARLVTVGDRLRGTAILGGSGTRARLGSGEVVFLSFAFDMKAADPIEAGRFWRTILNVPEPEDAFTVDRRGVQRPRRDRGIPEWNTEEVMEHLSTGHVAYSFKGVAWGIAVVGLFLVFIGPLSYFRLRPRSRRRAAVGFFAALAVACATLASIGAALPRTATKLEHFVIVDEGLVQTVTMLRASEGREYAFTHEGAALAAPDHWSGRLDLSLDWMQESGSSTTLPVPLMRTARLVSARVVERDAFGVSCRWIDPQARTVRMRNDGPLTLRGCAVVTALVVFFVPDLPPGSAFDLDLDEAGSTTTTAWVAEPGARSIALLGLRRDERGLPVARPRQRKISAAERIHAGDAVFIGEFDRDVTGIAVDAAVPVEVRGLLRARVEAPDEGD